jgi:hypothetical protein
MLANSARSTPNSGRNNSGRMGGNFGRNAQRPEFKGSGFGWESPAGLLFHGNVVYVPKGC